MEDILVPFSEKAFPVESLVKPEDKQEQQNEIWARIFGDFMGPGPGISDSTDFKNRWALTKHGAIKSWSEKYTIAVKPEKKE